MSKQLAEILKQIFLHLSSQLGEDRALMFIKGQVPVESRVLTEIVADAFDESGTAYIDVPELLSVVRSDVRARNKRSIKFIITQHIFMHYTSTLLQIANGRKR